MTEPVKVLRHGDAFTGQLPERRAPLTHSKFVAQAAAYIEWERNASVADLKDRVKKDPGFAAWYASQQPGIGGR